MNPEVNHVANEALPSRRIASDLRAKIESGELSAGSKLPSHRTLASDYGTAINTASEAIRILVDEGLVIRHHGKGNFVRENAPLIRLGGDRYSRRYRGGPTPFRRECQQLGLSPRVGVLSVDNVSPPAEIRERLQLGADETVLRRINQYFANDEPVQVVTTYIPWATAEGTALVEPKQTGPDGIYGRLEECGHTMTRIREEVSTRMPNAQERNLLASPSGTPVVQVLHTSYDQNGQPFEVTQFVLRGDRNGLLYDLPVD